MDKMDKKDFLYLKRLEIEPFFKYFKIYRKILFLFMVLITGVSFYFFENIDTYSCAITNNFCSIFKIENFNITNPILLFTFFIFLFLLHYLSLFLMKKLMIRKVLFTDYIVRH